ncbi:MAG: hypothetical protein Q4D81_04810, partial [Eubacteriales bacterium]|nr:hypothetical protein [Eubacteriales bacterium]
MRSDNNDTKMKSGVQSGTGCLFSDKKPRRRKILTRPAVIAAAIALCLLAACGKKETGGSEEIPAEQTAQTPQEAGSSGEGREAIPVPDNSILLFKEDSGFARLREDMESGDTPVECNVLYDEGGARQGVTVDDPEVIRELYTCLAAVTVGEKSDESAADCRHHITFRLRNDTYVGVGFEGESLLCWGQESYTVRGAAPLWAYVRMLQDEAMEKTAKKSDST